MHAKKNRNKLTHIRSYYRATALLYIRQDEEGSLPVVSYVEDAWRCFAASGASRSFVSKCA